MTSPGFTEPAEKRSFTPSSKPIDKESNMRKLFRLVSWTIVALIVPAVALAADGSGDTLGPGLGAGLAIGLSALGCGLGQGITAANTTAGIARNPGSAGALFVNFILGMVLIESIAIYGLVIAFQLQGKIG